MRQDIPTKHHAVRRVVRGEAPDGGLRQLGRRLLQQCLGHLPLALARARPRAPVGSRLSNRSPVLTSLWDSKARGVWLQSLGFLIGFKSHDDMPWVWLRSSAPGLELEAVPGDRRNPPTLGGALRRHLPGIGATEHSGKAHACACAMRRRNRHDS